MQSGVREKWKINTRFVLIDGGIHMNADDVVGAHTAHINPAMVKKEKGGQPQSDQIILGSGVDFAPLCRDAISTLLLRRRPEDANKQENLFFLLARIFSKRLEIATHNIQIMCRARTTIDRQSSAYV